MTFITFMAVGSSDASDTDRRESRSVGLMIGVGLESGTVMSYICKRKSSRGLEPESRG